MSYFIELNSSYVICNDLFYVNVDIMQNDKQKLTLSIKVSSGCYYCLVQLKLISMFFCGLKVLGHLSDKSLTGILFNSFIMRG